MTKARYRERDDGDVLENMRWKYNDENISENVFAKMYFENSEKNVTAET